MQWINWDLVKRIPKLEFPYRAGGSILGPLSLSLSLPHSKTSLLSNIFYFSHTFHEAQAQNIPKTREEGKERGRGSKRNGNDQKLQKKGRGRNATKCASNGAKLFSSASSSPSF